MENKIKQLLKSPDSNTVLLGAILARNEGYSNLEIFEELYDDILSFQIGNYIYDAVMIDDYIKYTIFLNREPILSISDRGTTFKELKRYGEKLIEYALSDNIEINTDLKY